MNGRLRQLNCGWAALTLSLSSAFVFFFAPQIRADDLRTISGRLYKDAAVLRVDSDGVVFSHKFGVVKISNSQLSPETRREFDIRKVKADEQRRRAEQQSRRAEEQTERAEEIRQQKVNAERAGVEIDEQDQEHAEEVAARIQRHRSEPPKPPTSTQHYRLRGEVIGLGTDWVLVLCDGGGPLSRLKKSIGMMKESTLTIETPGREVVILTGLHQLPVEASDVDVSVQAVGTRHDVRTRTGETYAGRYRVFRAVDG